MLPQAKSSCDAGEKLGYAPEDDAFMLAGVVERS